MMSVVVVAVAAVDVVQVGRDPVLVARRDLGRAVHVCACVCVCVCGDCGGGGDGFVVGGGGGGGGAVAARRGGRRRACGCVYVVPTHPLPQGEVAGTSTYNVSRVLYGDVRYR